MVVAGQVLMLVGAAWMLLAAVGVNRFGDVYARMHAATKSTTLGLLLVLVGASLDLPALDAAKLLLAAALLFLTAPLGAHLVGRSVHRHAGLAAVRIDTVDELAADEQRDGAADPGADRDAPLHDSPPHDSPPHDSPDSRRHPS